MRAEDSVERFIQVPSLNLADTGPISGTTQNPLNPAQSDPLS